MPSTRRGPRSSGAAAPSVRQREAAGILLAVLGVFLALAFVPDASGRQNLVGPLGGASHELLTRLLGWGGLLVPLLAVVWGFVLVRGRAAGAARRFTSVTIAGVLACLTAVAVFGGSAGEGAAGVGAVALFLAQALRAALGVAGALLALALAVLLTLVFAIDARPPSAGLPALPRARRAAAALAATGGLVAAAAVWLVSWVGGLLAVIGVALVTARSRVRRPRRASTAAASPAAVEPAPPETNGGTRSRAAAAAAMDPAMESARRGADARGAPRAVDRRSAPAGPASEWHVPLDLFDAPPPRDASASERELQELGGVLIRKLADFNVRGEVVRISSGPVITQFEVEPAPGVKVNQIATLADDLALAMRAQRIRIVAPIPGKGAVGIEIPNARPERVTIRELLESPDFVGSRGPLPFALGKEISGAPVVTELTRMPHLLIAGSTGSGKSVCINALLTSFLVRFSPAELRLILVDPKMLELSMYNEVPHLLHPVVTRPKDAAIALKWGVYEMERRFELLARNAVRNIADFNARLRAGARLEGVDSRLGTAEEPLRPLPYVVVIVDELADLMLTVQAEIEEPLARLAQKARAVGIHVVLATQRPSVNVLTGFIKANFPSRISFQVASKTDSRTVLDQNGAEALLGTGDMLFLPADRAVPIRIQGAFVSSRETEALVETVREMGRARQYRDRETIDLQQVEGAELEEGAAGDRDELFFDAARVVIEHDQGSTSLLQRRLKVGYSRAARIVDQLERHGIVGPADGSKPREVRIGLEELAEMQSAAGTRTTPRSTSPA